MVTDSRAVCLVRFCSARLDRFQVKVTGFRAVCLVVYDFLSLPAKRYGYDYCGVPLVIGLLSRYSVKSKAFMQRTVHANSDVFIGTGRQSPDRTVLQPNDGTELNIHKISYKYNVPRLQAPPCSLQVFLLVS